jgi:AcrR family transcriptional regulator
MITMTHPSAAPARAGLKERVLSATISLILSNGIRKLRTADIAREAETTESTLFRHFDSLDQILADTYDLCWALINHEISQAGFTRARLPTAQAELLADLDAVWSMKNNQRLGQAATVAFLFLRRRAEILDDNYRAPEQDRFERRVESICRDIVTEGDRRKNPHTLVQLLLNYCATVWLTWFCMPSNVDDVLAEGPDLTPDEAQLGVLVLLERFLTSDELDTHRGSIVGI